MKSSYDAADWSVLSLFAQGEEESHWCTWVITDRILSSSLLPILSQAVAYPGIFFGGGSTNSVEDRENGDLEVVAP